MTTPQTSLSNPIQTPEMPPSLHADKYKLAIESHKHYDTLSLSVIGGMGALPLGFLSARWPSFIPYYKFMPIILFVFFELLLFCLYLQLSWYATISRNTAAELEITDGPGISHVFKYLHNISPYQPTKGFKPCLSIKNTIYTMFFTIVFISFVILWFACA